MRWMTVKEAMPIELDREYLVWCDGNKCVYTAQLVEYEKGKIEWRCFNSDEELPCEVTHWMPCPIGPKKE